MVAQSYARPRLQAGDEILLTEMEHHANIVPWQLVCEHTGAVLCVVPVNDRGELIMERFEELLGPRTRLVAVTHMSNVLGTHNPVEYIIKRAHALGVPVLLDGAQAAPHTAVDVQALGCDFYVFSGHKLYGPTGIGVLYGKAELLESMPPYQGGGDMIRMVTSFEKSIFNDIPYKFEAGTPHIAGAIGLGAAIDYLDRIGLATIAKHEATLLAHATALLEEIPGLHITGTAPGPADATHESHDLNPLCGDEITVYLTIYDGFIRDVGFSGHGCAISTASASLMTESLKGKTIEQALFQDIHHLLTQETGAQEQIKIGQLHVLAGIKKFPARMQCAMLAWHIMHAALTLVHSHWHQKQSEDRT